MKVTIISALTDKDIVEVKIQPSKPLALIMKKK